MTQSIPTGQIDKSKKLFIASGVLAVVYAVLSILLKSVSYQWSQLSTSNCVACVLSIILSLSFLPLGIYSIICKKNNTVTMVLSCFPHIMFMVYVIYSLSKADSGVHISGGFAVLLIFLIVLFFLSPFAFLSYISFSSRLNLKLAITFWIIALKFWGLFLFLFFPSAIGLLFSSASLTGLIYLFIVSCLPAFTACFGQACITSSPVAKPSKPLTLFDGYCDMTKHVLLLLFTFGIWQYIWIYRTTEYLNAAFDGQKRNPATKLLLCMFVPFYYIYWVYQSAKRIDALARQNGVASDISTVSTVLAVFIGFVPPILMQSKLNQICASKGYPAYAASPAQPAYQAAPQPSYQPQSNYQAPAAPAQPTAGGDTADELRKLKSLLDDGIITPEEFDAKKKQLLGL